MRHKHSQKAFKKNSLQWLGFILAIILFFILHFGSQFFYALSIGAFEEISFSGVLPHIDINEELMSSLELDIFRSIGPFVTIIVGYVLVILAKIISKNKSIFFLSIFYYITIMLLLADPIYLSLVYRLIDKDMATIIQALSQDKMAIIFGIISIINILIIVFYLVPVYKHIFKDKKSR